MGQRGGAESLGLQEVWRLLFFYRQVFKTSGISGLRVPKGGFQNSCYG